MPTIVGILTVMSRKNSILGLSEPKKAEFLDIFILTSNSVEHEKSFITSGPDLFTLNIHSAVQLLISQILVSQSVSYTVFILGRALAPMAHIF